MTPAGTRRFATRSDAAEVWVEVDGIGITAGQLYSHRSRGAESASFTYHQSYLADPRGYALDPTLPLVSGTQQTPLNQRIFGAFSDSCPDRWGQRLIERAERRRAEAAGSTPRSFGAFDLLLGVRDDLRQGAIRFALDGAFVADDASGVPAMTDLPTLLSAADAMASDQDDSQSLGLLLRAGSSRSRSPSKNASSTFFSKTAGSTPPRAWRIASAGSLCRRVVSRSLSVRCRRRVPSGRTVTIP